MKNIFKTFSLAAIICAASFAQEGKTITIDQFNKSKNNTNIVYTPKTKSCDDTTKMFAKIWNTKELNGVIEKITDQKTFKKAFTILMTTDTKYGISTKDGTTVFNMEVEGTEGVSFLFFDTVANCKKATDGIQDELVPFTEPVASAATAE